MTHELVEPVMDGLKDRERDDEDLDGGSIAASFAARPNCIPGTRTVCSLR